MWSTLPTPGSKKSTSTKKGKEKVDEMCYAVGSSSLGQILVATVNNHVRYISLGSNKNVLLSQLKVLFPQTLITQSPRTEIVTKQIISHLENPLGAITCKTNQPGTEFQHKVWKAICCIPVGETRSYAQLAEMIGSPQSVRAVASACGKNSLAIVVPCHRVIGSDGGLGGYRWGVEIKRQLLEREKKIKEGMKEV